MSIRPQRESPAGAASDASVIGGQGPSVNSEFVQLSAARKIIAPASSTGSLVADRANAARWIEKFATAAVAPSDGKRIEQGDHSVVIRPACEAPCTRRIFYIHGGGLVYYSTDVFRPLLSSWANALCAEVEAFDYLKAPEHSVHQSVEQLTSAVRARAQTADPRPIVLAGDSVGALLALYLGLRALPGAFSRLVLIYPVLDLESERASYCEFGDGYFLDRVMARCFKSIVAPFFTEHAFDPFGLSDGELSGLQQCALVTAGCDVLCDEGLDWAAHLRGRGVTVHHQHFPELPHDFCLYSGKLTSAKKAAVSIAMNAFN